MKSNQDEHKPLVGTQLRNVGQIMHKTFHEDSIKKKLKIRVSRKVQRKRGTTDRRRHNKSTRNCNKTGCSCFER